MKNLIFNFTIITFAILIFNSFSHKFEEKKINSIINKVKTDYAPDKRVAIFSISVENNGNKIKLEGESNLEDGVNELMNELEKQNLSVVNEVNLLPDNKLGEKIYGIVRLSVANIRSKPSHPAELATQALMGSTVNILKKENGWYLVQTPDGYISWVDDDGIHPITKEEVKNWKNSKRVIITEQYTSAFAEPGTNSKKISDLVDGNILKKISNTGKFTEVGFPDGRVGFVISSHLKDFGIWAKNAVADKNTIIKTAFNFMGLPYLWGGTSSKGVDCSGFTKTVFFLNGVVMPRDASQQVNVGELVDTENNFDNLQEGDLLFFGKKASEDNKEKITHVAIYIGEGKYIHSAGIVRINSLIKDSEDFNEYRYNTFIRAKRIIGNYDSGENLVKNNPFYN
jgi:cell wall-associated NlpC family hydrolase